MRIPQVSVEPPYGCERRAKGEEAALHNDFVEVRKADAKLKPGATPRPAPVERGGVDDKVGANLASDISASLTTHGKKHVQPTLVLCQCRRCRRCSPRVRRAPLPGDEASKVYAALGL